MLSLEDPVEYYMDGVNQSQVRPEIGYDFASGLRTTLRQDPDIIMVGEIRDKETAQLAVQAALTGHLVFSTLHTNNAAGVIPRLIDMGVDPYLIAPTLILRHRPAPGRALLCPDGGKAIPVEGSIKAMIDKQFADLPEEYQEGDSVRGHRLRAIADARLPERHPRPHGRLRDVQDGQGDRECHPEESDRARDHRASCARKACSP